MEGVASFCLVCGDVTGPDQFQCPEHVRARQTTKNRERGTTTEQGRGGAWIRLSRRARTRQPFCTDCGVRSGLQADHLPSAWWKHEQGLPLTLADVDVTCGPCNAARGSSKPGTPRYDAWMKTNG